MIFHYRPSDVARRLLIAEGLDLGEVEDYRIVFKGNRRGVVEEIKLMVEMKEWGEGKDEPDR